jgi:TonB family protein
MAVTTRKAKSNTRSAISIAVVAVFAVLAFLLYRVMSAPSSVAKHTVPDVVQLRIIQPPPPPPPPPPQQKVEEQPKMKQPEFKPEPHPEDKPPPPGPPALDAQGQGPGDAFGLAGRPGGSDYVGDGNGTGGGSRYGWYATMMTQRAQDALQKQRRLNGVRYRIAVQIWLSDSGAPLRVELVNSTGKPEIDAVLQESLRNMPKLAEPPPKDMPQPVVMEVTSS